MQPDLSSSAVLGTIVPPIASAQYGLPVHSPSAAAACPTNANASMAVYRTPLTALTAAVVDAGFALAQYSQQAPRFYAALPTDPTPDLNSAENSSIAMTAAARWPLQQHEEAAVARASPSSLFPVASNLWPFYGGASVMPGPTFSTVAAPHAQPDGPQPQPPVHMHTVQTPGAVVPQLVENVEPYTAWATSMFACFMDVPSCLDAFLCPRCQVARQYNAVTQHVSSVNWNMFATVLVLDLFFLSLTWVCPVAQVLFTLKVRRMLRARYGIEGTNLDDMAAACCCQSCAIAQQHREIVLRREWPSGTRVSRPFQMDHLSVMS